MIANNFRKFAAAAAVQGVLSFGRPVWALGRPSTRLLRALRASRAKLINSRPQLVNWVKAITPQWVKDAMKNAKALAKQWADAQMVLPLLTETETAAIQPVKTTVAQVKKQAAKNHRADLHAGLCPGFLVLGAGWQLGLGREICIGGYRQMHGYIDGANRCPKTQQYGANA